MQPLTPVQLETLDYLRAYIAEHRYAPTLREVSEEFAVSHVSALQRLRRLEAKGYIRR